jgi:Serine dehydrogenase proteinase
MSTWSEVLKETLNQKTDAGHIDYDGVRREKLRAVSNHTKRPLIIYAADFLNEAKADMAAVSIDYSDKQGFSEVIENVGGDSVDVLLHSPGGMAEATESIVAILRSTFHDVRFFVPNIAKSAATMLALSGDQILMDEASELGPIDPQFTFRKGDGTVVTAPAQAIIDQFELAEARISKDPTLLAPWLPILQQYGPSLYKQAKNAIDLSRSYVEEWLSRFMFKAQKDGREKAKKVAGYLGDHNNFKSHAKRIGLDDIAGIAQLNTLNVYDLRKDPVLRGLVRGLYHSISIPFDSTPTYKLFENGSGRTLARLIRQVLIPVPTERPKGPGSAGTQPST